MDNTDDDLDDGVRDATHCRLREAIEAANAPPGEDVISFGISGLAPRTVAPATPLPVVTEAVVIDATTEADFAGYPVVVLDGAALMTGHGLQIDAAASSELGLAIGGFPESGVYVSGAAGATRSSSWAMRTSSSPPNGAARSRRV